MKKNNVGTREKKQIIPKIMNGTLRKNGKPFWKESSQCKREVCVKRRGVLVKSGRVNVTEDKVCEIKRILENWLRWMSQEMWVLVQRGQRLGVYKSLEGEEVITGRELNCWRLGVFQMRMPEGWSLIVYNRGVSCVRMEMWKEILVSRKETTLHTKWIIMKCCNKVENVWHTGCKLRVSE